MNTDIYNDISKRTGGDIYIGVVGPVRTGKSTFIKRFMESLVIPNITDDNIKERAKDELPQSSGGKTIMTTEPKFIPEDAVELCIDKASKLKVRMIDCVGYIVPSSEGYYEDDAPRMVTTPWSEEEIPFNLAAEIGTKKVIEEHSTIGLVVTTDGSISQIPRQEYEEAEKRVIDELKAINKPFVVLLNCTNPNSKSSIELANELSIRYSKQVIPVNCIELDENKIKEIITGILYEFPVSCISFNLPNWFKSLDDDDELRQSISSAVLKDVGSISTIRSVSNYIEGLAVIDEISDVEIKSADLSCGNVCINANIDSSYFYAILSRKCSIKIENERDLMQEISYLSKMKKEYLRLKDALNQVEQTGYGIVMPTVDELSLEDPEIMKQGGKYGVRLKAHAPSIHMIKCNTYTEVAPIVGSESQSEELVMYLLKEFENNPSQIWETNIFGKSLHSLVSEGLNNKLYRMPEDARDKFRETIERVINEGCSGLICIIL